LHASKSAWDVATILAQTRRLTNPVPEKIILRLVEKLEPSAMTEGHQLTVL
jgi:hypothetical protein